MRLITNISGVDDLDFDEVAGLFIENIIFCH